jgi:hypothetical protein
MNKTIDVVLVGTTPLMVKSDRTVDPFDSYVVQMKPLTKKGQKRTEEDIALLRRLEWEAGLYYSDEHGPFIPGWNLTRSIRGGAERGKGKDTIRAIICEEVVPIIYDGPRDIDGMYAAGAGRDFVDVRRVVNKGGGGSTMRARPRFNKWRLETTIEIDTAVLDEDDLIRFIVAAGKYEGLGEFRPGSPKGGHYGKYRLDKINGQKVG